MALVVGAVGVGAALALCWAGCATWCGAGSAPRAPAAPIRAPARRVRPPRRARPRARRSRCAQSTSAARPKPCAIQAQVVAAAPRAGSARPGGVLAGLHYELGRERFDRGAELARAIEAFKDARRGSRSSCPPPCCSGRPHLKGEPRDALRVWERAAEAAPSALPGAGPHRGASTRRGTPHANDSLYRTALDRHPDNLALAFGLGRVYFELAMLDEAAEQFQKMEVRAADLPAHPRLPGRDPRAARTYRDAMEEYRRALRLSDSVQWPHHCATCGALHPRWVDRCPSCRRWNTSRP